MNRKSKKTNVAIAVCSFELSGSVPSEIRLIPAGLFRARDGRADSAPDYRLDAAIAQRVLARLKNRVGDIVIDYEHQTLNSEKNGQPAPAAGWFSGSSVEWRDDGLWAVNVRWTDPAAALIAKNEYRYLSPVFPFDPATGEVQDVLMMALTNFPAIDGHGDLAQMAALKFSLPANDEDIPVKREELIKLLGLAADATDEQISSGLAALKAAADQTGTLQTEVATLKGQVADPAKFVPIAVFDGLKAEVATLKGQINGSEVDALIQGGIDAGKLLPVQVDWARALGASDIAALKGYLDKTPAIPGLRRQTDGKPPVIDNVSQLNAEQLAVCKATGVSHADFIAALKAQEVAQ